MPRAQRRGRSSGSTVLPALQERYDLIDGVRVYSVVAEPDRADRPEGRAVPADVVLVHGLALSTRYLEPGVRRLGTDRRTAALDLPGVGRSGRPPHLPSMAEMADVVARWMDGLGMTGADVVGHSLGCQIVSHLAAERPDLVRRVVLVGPSRDPEHPRWWQSAWRLLLDGPRERWSLLPIAVVDYLRAGPVAAVRALKQARRAEVSHLVQSITQPVLVVVGDRDPLVSGTWARRLVDALPDGRLVTVPGAPHGLPYSSVESFVTTTRDFLDREEP